MIILIIVVLDIFQSCMSTDINYWVGKNIGMPGDIFKIGHVIREETGSVFLEAKQLEWTGDGYPLAVYVSTKRNQAATNLKHLEELVGGDKMKLWDHGILNAEYYLKCDDHYMLITPRTDINLSDLLKGPSVDITEIIQILYLTFQSMRWMHEMGIAHGNLIESNIAIDNFHVYVRGFDHSEKYLETHREDHNSHQSKNRVSPTGDMMALAHIMRRNIPNGICDDYYLQSFESLAAVPITNGQPNYALMESALQQCMKRLGIVIPQFPYLHI